MKVWIRWNTVLGNSTTEGEFVEDAGEFYWREGICVKRFYLSLPSFWAVQTKSGHPLSCNYKCYIFNRSEDTLRVRKVLSRVRHSSNSFVCSLYETIVLAGKTQSQTCYWASFCWHVKHHPGDVFISVCTRTQAQGCLLTSHGVHKWNEDIPQCFANRKRTGTEREIDCVILSSCFWYLFHDVIQEPWDHWFWY